MIERITSRKNALVTHLRQLAADGGYRRACGELVCDGRKLLDEALRSKMEITAVLTSTELSIDARQYLAPAELVGYASPLKNSPGPVFSIKLPESGGEAIGSAIILDGVQDPGNVGTIIRTADAFGIDAVVLTGGCADLYGPKTVRSSMGSIFRQRVLELDLGGISELMSDSKLPLYGAALSENALPVSEVSLERCAVAIGSEGRGLSAALLSICDGELIIPISPLSESLNAAIAGSILMWEMSKAKNR